MRGTKTISFFFGFKWEQEIYLEDGFYSACSKCEIIIIFWHFDFLRAKSLKHWSWNKEIKRLLIFKISGISGVTNFQKILWRISVLAKDKEFEKKMKFYKHYVNVFERIQQIILRYSKASRYTASSCTDLAGALFRIGSKKIWDERIYEVKTLSSMVFSSSCLHPIK